MPVFLDANILFSASNESSELHRFMLWLRGKEARVTSAYADSEAERNILAKRPGWHNSFLLLRESVEIVPEAPLRARVDLPDKDRPILGAAIAAKCDFLLTGDKRDFGHLYGQTVDGVLVTGLLDFAHTMLERHGRQ